MWLVRGALRRPITILVVVVALVLGSYLAINRMAVDIFPNFGLPVIYVAQPYGGMDPAQMEGYVVSYYEYHFLYIVGIEHVESKSIQGVALVKLFFHPGTDMSQALAQTVSYVNRSRAFMPPGTVPPFVMRFDVGSVAVGQLVFSSETRSLGEISDLALFRVRPVFSTLPGVSAPPPFGGNQRTVVIRVQPERLRAYGLSPEDVVKAVAAGNTIMPAGTVRTGDLARMAPVNAVVNDIQELRNIPIRTGAGPAVLLRDLGTVENGMDILTGYALVNGKRAVYIPVTKRADASTLAVVNQVKSNLPRMQAMIPDDIKIRFEFDQSRYVLNAIHSVIAEGLLGALLTGVAVLLFLRNWRSALIVVTTIPLALLSSLIALWIAGHTLNIMTLGGLALAVGILVDEATVTIENIHTHLARGKSRARAVLEASTEVAGPRLLAMLSILAVFLPSFFMAGVSRALFVPLSLAVGFSMVGSYFLASTLVPILSTWILKEVHADAERQTPFDRMRARYASALEMLLRFRWPLVAGYLAVAALVIYAGGRALGVEMFPTVDTGQFQLRFRAPIGTRVERTELAALKILDAIREEAGEGNVDISLGFVGTQPSTYPVNSIHLWTGGPHEGVLLVALKKTPQLDVQGLKERLRKKLPPLVPGAAFSFEAGDIVSQVMSFGSPTPVEVAVSGPSLAADRQFAEKLMAELKAAPILRDLQYGQPLDYPTVEVNIDRERAGQLGLTIEQVSRSLVAATSSSRFTQPVFWRDPSSGTAYQVQIEVPQAEINSIEDVQNIPVRAEGTRPVTVRDLARVSYGTMPGEYDRYNMQRMVTITANVAGAHLGEAADRVEQAVRNAGSPPRAVSVAVRGQVAPLRQMLDGLRLGLLLAIAIIFLLLAANFQSLRLAFAVISTVPAVIGGVIVALLATGTTLNVQSFMGAIMAIGVAVANAILLVTFAEARRKEGGAAVEAAVYGAQSRLRPILMTSVAMMAGMMPLALGAEQTAPLGRAVIGGLVAATLATLVVLPSVFSLVQQRRYRSASLDPSDPDSRYFEGDPQ